ncbi:MAG: hypothetical protein RJA34_2572 [Pseudomonadota bacterium]
MSRYYIWTRPFLTGVFAAPCACSSSPLALLPFFQMNDSDLHQPSPPGPAQRLLRAAQRRVLTVFGRIKVYLKPPAVLLAYDPGSYKVNGKDCRTLISQLQPGDILLRSFDNYLDGHVIRRTRTVDGPKVGVFTHVAIYVGELTQHDRPSLASLAHGYDWSTDTSPAPGLALEAFREAQRVRHFDQVVTQPNQMVIHAMADGVKVEDILTFARCDHLLVLRLPTALTHQPRRDAGTDVPDASLQNEHQRKLHADLLCGKAVPAVEVVALARELAMGMVGADYDFNCDDVKKHHYFSCAELVYYCYRTVADYLDIVPRDHSLWIPWTRWRVPGTKRRTLAPDDFMRGSLRWKPQAGDNTLRRGLQRVWMSHTLNDDFLDQRSQH